jgi:hypothetical protein
VEAEHTSGDGGSVWWSNTHKLTAFIYGTLAGLAAVLGIETGQGASWLTAASIIVAGSLTMWVAHAYCGLLGRGIAEERPFSDHALSKALRDEWPVAVAGLPLVLPLLAVAVGLWSLDTALLVSSLVGVTIFALIGIAAGVTMEARWLDRLVLVLVSAGLGVLILMVELALKH